MPMVKGSCPKCKAPVALDEKFCSACGADYDVELEILAFKSPALASARKWILGIGIWYVVSAFLELAMMKDRITPDGRNLVLGISFGLCAVHVGLFFWAKRQAFAAAIVALVLFATLQAVQVAMSPKDFYKGFLIKIIFIVVLAKAVQAGYEANKLRGKRT